MENQLKEESSMSRNLSKEEQKQAGILFQEYQGEYNKTHDTEVLWNKMVPLIKTALEAAIKKGNQHNEVRDFEDKVETGLFNIVARYIKNPEYHHGSLPTLVFFEALVQNRNPKTVFHERDCIQYDDWVEWYQTTDEAQENDEEFYRLNEDAICDRVDKELGYPEEGECKPYRDPTLDCYDEW